MEDQFSPTLEQKKSLSNYLCIGMGNQRQMLKGNIEKELVFKIEAAKDVLSQLNKSLEISHQNSYNAKEEISITAAAIQEVLAQRKNELLQEIENLYQAQVRPLQDAIKSTYITMGKLQSMLSNLDSFDQSQLVNLQIPAVDTSCTLNEPAQISTSVECDKIKEELKEWGNITTDEFQCYMFDDLPENLRHESDKRASSVVYATSENSSHVSKPSMVANKENVEVLSNPDSKQYSPWNSWGIENWLSSSNKKSLTSNTNEDKNDFVLISQNTDEEMDYVVPDAGGADGLLNDSLREDDESSSSIVCIGRETLSPKHNDLSMWLKPKKMNSLQKVPCNDKEVQACQVVNIVHSENISKPLTEDTCGKRTLNSVNKRLDFPCLHMGTETWIHKRKPKSASSISSNKPHTFLHNEKLKLIPPNYTLPNPFWLKKYQKR